MSPPPVGERGFGVSNGRRCAVIRVSVTYGELCVEADFEADHYSPDVVEGSHHPLPHCDPGDAATHA